MANGKVLQFGHAGFEAGDLGLGSGAFGHCVAYGFAVSFRLTRLDAEGEKLREAAYAIGASLPRAAARQRRSATPGSFRGHAFSADSRA